MCSFSWKSGPIPGKASESSTLSPVDPYKELREINFIHLTLQLEGKKNIIFYQRWKIVFMTGFLLLWLPGYQTSNGHSKYSTFTERVGRADSDCLFTGGKSQWYWDCCDQQLQLHQHRDMRRQTLVLLFSLTSVLLQQKIREILKVLAWRKVDKGDFSFTTVYVWSMEAVVSFSFTTDVCG